MRIVGTNRGEALARILAGAALLGLVLWRTSCASSCASEPADQVEEDFRMLRRKLKLYADGHTGLPRSFDRLVSIEEGWQPLLNELPRDPWGKLYQLEVQANHYTIVSDGPDTAPGTDDDLRAEGDWTAPAP